MESDAALLPPFNKQEPIPGYVVKELLGTGGYGEVWKCHAPGGLYKAVKIISSNSNSKHASSELRSLNRIKEVRHPFLLSIERIEVIGGTAVIVTELADQSLKRQFQKYRAKGQTGVPRDELLGYLRDAADALDYIYDNFSLQHLDIKPENLLIVGDRAKVADFGMIKNLYDRSNATIEGLTPAYAPPELFEGKPNRNSDQYSLAVVYYEMLTGSLPFDGTTASQLAAQHLHTAPVLLALPKGDQPVIARALSKDPGQRFASCRALIESLVEAGKSKAHTNVAPVRSPRAQVPVASTEPSFTEALDLKGPLADQGFEAPIAPTGPLAQLPAIQLDLQNTNQCEPVLFIGIGGTATRILRKLRRRIHDRLGPLEGIPAIQLLLIDTDVKSLNRATDGEHGTAIDGSERLPMPLRRSEEYRSSASNILASIGRRWLFNVPYSLETEGYRPLGRLALIDHSKRLLERLRQSLIRITSDDSLEQSSKATGISFMARQPRVFVIASSAGGTGSGMVLDVAYAVRAVLAKLDLPDANVNGVLTHSTAHGQRESDRAIANSYATLNELWHYSQPGQCYPGDRGCGLPAFHGNNRTFSSCYFVNLGSDLSELQVDIACDPIAEYLYANAFTPAAEFFDKCRHLEYMRWGTEFTEPVVRTFGLSQLGGSNSEIPTVIAELLCKDLVHRWRGDVAPEKGQTAALPTITAALSVSENDPTRDRFPEIDAQAALKASELGLSLEKMALEAHAIFDEELLPTAESYFEKLIEDAQKDAKEIDKATIIARIDSKLSTGDEAALDSIATAVDTRLEGRATKLAAAIRDWIFDLVDGPDGVAGAQHAAEWFRGQLRDFQTTAAARTVRLREQALSTQHMILRARNDMPSLGTRIWGRRKPVEGVDGLLRAYVEAQVDQAVTCSTIRWLRLVEAQVNAELARLQSFWKDLTALAGKFQVSQSLEEVCDLGGEPGDTPTHWRKVLNSLICQRHALVESLDRHIDHKLALGTPKLRWYLTRGEAIDAKLTEPL